MDPSTPKPSQSQPDNANPPKRRRRGRRRPASKCMLCRQTLEQIVGRRLGGSSSLFNGLRLSPTPQRWNRHDRVERAIEVQRKTVYMIIWGDRWTDELIELTKADVLAGRLPWICQRCANRVCRECDSLLRIVPAADLVADDGRVTHQPAFPVGRLCSNPSCKQYRPPG